MATLQDVQTWKGMKVVDTNGEKIGTVEAVFLDRHTGEPAWAAVKTGLFGLKHSVVPLRGAEPAGEDELRVQVTKDQAKDAPRIDPDGELTPEEERQLFEHYGRSDYDEWQGEDRTTDLDLPAETRGQEGDEPAVVGVRLRRVVVITARPEDGR